MSRQLIVVAACLLAGGVAHAESIDVDPTSVSSRPSNPHAPADMHDQALGASIGAAVGGRTSPGGLRVSGHYLYQLTDQDWFDGVAAFTFGGTDAACFRDRMNAYLCEHGIADGNSVELAGYVRHFLGGNGEFWPFVHAGAGLAIVRFGDDSVTGVSVPLHAGGGLRVSVTDTIAIVAHAELQLGIGLFNHSLGFEPQFGASVHAGAEFGL
jgi:hypothetical protein